jgi:protein-L-isoaspartate(D-aspartate) O-methyltransferase
MNSSQNMQVDRAHYAPSSAYEDSPQPIGHRATISAPHMHASACESLLPYLHPGASILDIGSGSGYLTAVLANLVGPSGTVIGIDHIQPLVALAQSNMEKSEAGRHMLDSGQVKFVKGDGRKGWQEGAPYDAIHVGAAAAEHHKELEGQLKAPGRMFVPVEEGWMQYIYVVNKKEDGSVEKEKLYGVQYVPLTDAPQE